MLPQSGSPRPGSSIALARLLSPIYGGLGLLVALALDRDVLETLKLGYSMFAAGIILPVLAALWPRSRALTARGAIPAMISGAAVAVAGRFRPALTFGHDPVLAGTAVNAAVLIVSALLTKIRGSGRAGIVFPR